MHSNCNDLRKCIHIKSGDARKPKERTFIRDRQHLESGASQESWFESLTACQIQSRKSSKVKQRWSVIDSPSSSPTISQLIHVSLGSSPAGWRHSSPAHSSDKEDNNRISYDIPQSDSWERPLLGLSPGPSPIVHSIASLSRTSSGAVHSLGLDDSALSWTNSLATPPRDGSEVESFEGDTDSSQPKTKDTARALFSPGSRLDTTGDSIRPLDSTFEDDQFDLNESQSDNLQTTHLLSKEVGEKTDNMSLEEQSDNSSLNKSLSQEVMSKADILKQSPTVIKEMENWKDNFKKRLISRKDSLLENAKKFKSKDETNLTCFKTEIDDSKVKKDYINKSPEIQFNTKVIHSQSENGEMQLSPTFSQKKRQPKPTTKKDSITSRDETRSVDYVLSDFFDPPSGSVGKRKPAPSRKRKSLEMEESLTISEAANMSCNNTRITLNDSTSAETLHSILASDKKTKSSSSKKVRFSEKVKKHTFIPDNNSNGKEGKSIRKGSKRKSSCLKLKNTSCPVQLKNESIDIVSENESEILSEKEVLVKNIDAVIQSEHSSGNKEILIKNSKAVSCNKNKDESENIKERDKREGTEERLEEELFSQVSPTALKEMCNVAENYESSLIDISHSSDTFKDDVDLRNNQYQKPKAKKFYYPSVNQLSKSACKVFKYNKEESKDINRKNLLSSVKIVDIKNKDSDNHLMVEKLKIDNEGVLSEDDKENVTKQSSGQIGEVVDSYGSALKDDTADLKFMGCRKNIQGQCQKLHEDSGFHSASGKQVKIPQEALDIATSLLQEFKEINSSKYNSINATKQNLEEEKSLLTPIIETHINGNKPTFNLQEQYIEKDSRDNLIVPNLEPEKIEMYKGFQRASGKSLCIQPEAMSKALSLFYDENHKPEEKEGLKAQENASLRTNNLDIMPDKLRTNLKTNNDQSSSPLDGMALLNKKESYSEEHAKKIQSSNASFKNCTGFQSASGKILHIPNKALEKAQCLLQEENIFPSFCSKQYTETDDKGKDQKNNIKYELEDGLNDMEFSEWCDDGTEPECDLFSEEAVKDENYDTERGEQSNEPKVKDPKAVEDENESSKRLSKQSNSDIQISENDKVTHSTCPKDNVAVDEISGFKTKESSRTTTKSYDWNHVREQKWQETNQSFAPCNGEFAGFKTASGKSMSLSKEKFKQAEQLLIDCKSENVSNFKECFDIEPSLKNNKHVDVMSKMHGNRIPENLLLQQERILMIGQDKPNMSINVDNNVTSAPIICLNKPLIEKQKLPVCGDKHGLTINYLQQACDIKQKLEKPKGNDQSKLSVADRLKLEFENQFHKLDNKTNSKDIEDELNKIKRCKESREVNEKTKSKQNVNIGSKDEWQTKTHAAMKPKGFCPFKPPKMSRAGNVCKYPESKRKDWNNENDNNLASAELSHLDARKGSDREHNTSGSDVKRTETKESVLYSDKDNFKQKRVHSGIQKEISVEHVVNLNNSNHNTSFNEIVCMSNRNVAEINTSHITDSNCSGVAKIDNCEKTNVTCEDFDDYSQIFDDEMDLTQIEAAEHACRSVMLDASDNQEVTNVSLESKSNEKVEKVPINDFSNSSGKENTIEKDVNEKPHANKSKFKSVKEDVSKTESYNYFQTDTVDRKLTDHQDCFGFSSASGKVIPFSKNSMTSAEQILSNCENDDKTKNVPQFDIKDGKNSELNECNIFKSSLNSIGICRKNDDKQTSYKISHPCTDKKMKYVENESQFSIDQVCKEEIKVDFGNDRKFMQHETLTEKKNKLSDNLNDKFDYNHKVNENERITKTSGEKKSSGPSKCGEVVQLSEPEVRETRNNICNENEYFVMNNNYLKLSFAENGRGKEYLLSKTYTDSDDFEESIDRLITSKKERPIISLSKIEINERNNDDILSKCDVSKSKVMSFDKTLHNACKNGEEKENEDLTKNCTSIASSEKVEFHLAEREENLNKDSSIIKNKEFSKSETIPEIKQLNNTLFKIIEITDDGQKHEKIVKSNDEIVFENQIANCEMKSILQMNFYEDDEADCKSKYCGCSSSAETLSEEKINIPEGIDAQHGLEENMPHYLGFNDANNKDKAQKLPTIDCNTASGKKINISESALSHIKGQFNDAKDEKTNSTLMTGIEKSDKGKVQNVPKFEGFRTASGHKVNVSEKALYYVRGQFLDTDVEDKVQNVPKFGDFNTASGNIVDVSDKALSYTRGQFHETSHESIVKNVPKFEGFNTASGNKVNVSEEALHYATGQFLDTDVEDKVPKFGGFSTASVNKVDVSVKALSNARQQIYETCEENKVQNVPKLEGLNTANGNKDEVSDKALHDSREHLHDTNDKGNVQNNPTCDPYNTVSGYKVNALEQVLSYSRELFGKTNVEDKVKSGSKFVGFSTASGNKVNISEKAQNFARQELIETNDKEKVQNVPKFEGFTTASGKKVNVSEKALSFARGQFLDTNVEDKVQNVPKFGGFNTASGNKVDASDEALSYTTGRFHETKEENIVQNVPKFEGCRSASENKVNVSKEALCYARGQFLDSNVEDKVQNVPKFDGFNTASGNKVTVSEKALSYARQQVYETYENDNVQNVPQFGSCSTASRNKVNVSEKALSYAQGQFLDTNDNCKVQNVPKFDGFNTASGNKVDVSEKALSYARQQFHDLNDEDKVQNIPKFGGFSTASGNKVNVSEKALSDAQGQFNDTDDNCKVENVPKFDGLSTISKDEMIFSQKALNYARQQYYETNDEDKVQNVPKFDGFSTASGNKVNVSEKALNYARQQFLGLNDENKVQNVPKFEGFSTASGNKVNVSEKALSYARGHFHEENDEHKIQNVPKCEVFCTASRDKVNESGNDLSYAKGQLLDTNVEGKIQNFQNFDEINSASGIKVNMTDKAFIYSREHFDEIIEGKIENNLQFGGFSTASGNKVQVSEKALSYARGQYHDTRDIGNSQDVSNFDAVCTISEDKCCDVGTENKITCNDTKNTNNHRKSENFREQVKHDADALIEKMKSDSDSGFDNTEISAKYGSDDLEEMFGMALKRRKLDLNKERKMLQKLEDEGPLGRRISGMRSNQVVSADKRHPGFRPFKPVFCKIKDSKADRTTDTVCAQQGRITSSNSDFKSSFKTPYRSNYFPPCTDSYNKKISGETPGLGAGDGDHNVLHSANTTETTSSGDCSNKCAMKQVQSERQDKLKDHIPTENLVPITGDDNDDRQIIEQSIDETALQGERESCQETSFKNNVTFDSEYVKSQQLVKLKTAQVQTNEKSDLNPDVSETLEKTEQNEFDSFSQDEDDVYYCMVVESRRYQEEIIKQRASTRVRPYAGQLLKMKQTDKRLKLNDVIDELNLVLERPSLVKVESAANYKFSMEFHYGKNTTHTKIGDGAYIVPDDAGYIGKLQFYKGFLTMDGVDAKLINESWVFNHYRWIIWKLAAYEKTSSYLRTRSLTPDMVMLQLKYRYDREVDLSQRSSIKKIYERDDTPSKRLVLCVAAVIKQDLQEKKVDQTKSDLHKMMHLELTDGWYSIPTQIDGPLTQLILQGKICVGHKLCITGAELIGGDDACTPLEAPSSVMLKICRNSTRPAPWDSKLGYQSDPRPLCVPLCGLDGDGGIAGVIDCVIVRKYPTLYMEKYEGGGCIFRTQRCEDRERQEYETRKQCEMEKVYRQMEEMSDKEDKIEKRRSMKKFKHSDIENLQCGQDIYDAMESAAQPDMIQNYLSDDQLNMLYEYRRQQQEQKQADLNSKFNRAWQEKLEAFPERQVTPVLKVRVAGCSNRDLDLNTSTILTIWRPSPEISDLEEGHRYKIYSLNTSVSRFSIILSGERSKYTGHSVQLTATKQTRYRQMQLDENILDNIYEPREVLWASDIKRRQPPFGELDFVGVVVEVTKSSVNDRICDMVYLADCQLGILAVRFWNGFQTFGEDLFRVAQILCCSNLMDKSPYRYSQIPIVEVSSEYTHISNKSQNAAQRKALEKLNISLKDKESFMEKANTAFESLLAENKNQTITKKVLEINADFIAEFPKSNLVKHEKTTGNLNVDNMDNIDLENDSFEEELKKHKTPIEVTAEIDSTASKNQGNIADNVKKEGNLEMMNKTSVNNDPCCSLEITGTPVNDRKHLMAQRKIARLMSYGSPSVLSPLNSSVPKSVTKGFKPPAFKKL